MDNRDRIDRFMDPGIATSYTMGGLLHILLVAATIIILIRIIQGRKIL